MKRKMRPTHLLNAAPAPEEEFWHSIFYGASLTLDLAQRASHSLTHVPEAPQAPDLSHFLRTITRLLDLAQCASHSLTHVFYAPQAPRSFKAPQGCANEVDDACSSGGCDAHDTCGFAEGCALK
eukprot:256844-Pelagomonas_calceolata.AAC.1